MCAASSDLTAAARIREAAMQLFAERGPAAVSIREIADDASVSPSLVIHHYGTKEGLKAAVDERVMALFGDVVDEFTVASTEGGSAESLTALIAERFTQEPSLFGYMRRLFVDGGLPAEALFRRLFDFALSRFAELEAMGLVRPPIDARVRAAFLVVNDLAAMILRDQIAAVLGADPLSPPMVRLWTVELMDVYTRGFFTIGEAAAPPEHHEGSPS